MNTANVSVTPVEPPSNIVPIGPLLPPVATLSPRSESPEGPVRKERGVTVNEFNVRGKIKFVVRYWEDGRPRRAYRDTATAANTFAAEKRGETLTNKKKLLLLPPADADMLILIYSEAQKRGIALMDVLKGIGAVITAREPSKTWNQVMALVIQDKRDHHCDEDYVDNLEIIGNLYGDGRGEMAIEQIATVENVKAFLRGRTVGYQKALRGRLSAFFSLAEDKEWIKKNPCKLLGKLSDKHKKAVDVFEIAEARTCLEWLVQHPARLPWFILSAFAGLRPEDEACLTGWDKISFEQKCIVVEAEVSKTGKRRVVYPPDMVFEWLKWAKDHGGELPHSYGAASYVQRKLRPLLGWTEWKQDVTRHSAATYWLASTNDAKKVSRSLGHSLSILDSTYDARKFEHEGKAYYALTLAALGVK
jgi:integrase